MKNSLIKKNVIISLFLVIIMTLFLLSAQLNMTALFSGVVVWATNILPALFPFLFFTKILTQLGFVERASKFLAPITKKLYNTPGISAYVYLISILSGYPVGAKLTSDLYHLGHLSYGQACRTTTFTSTSGPLFIVGTVGIGMFANQHMGLIVLLCHLLGALLNGLIYRNYKIRENHLTTHTEVLTKSNASANLVFTKNKPDNLLENAMYSSIYSILIIGGYIALFFMLITMFEHYNLTLPLNFIFEKMFGLLSLPQSLSRSLTHGLIEVTKGALTLSQSNTGFALSTIFATIIITFGGFSVHMQALTFLKKFKIKFSFYMLQKITHTIIATLLCVIYFAIF